MNKPIFLSISTTLLALSIASGNTAASELYIQGSIAISNSDINIKGVDLTQSTVYRVIGGANLLTNFSVEGGLYRYKSEQERQEDGAGQYETNFVSQDYLLGIKGHFPLNRKLSIYGRGGLLFWNTEFEVKETYSGSIPSKKSSIDDKGIGYYLSTGGTYHFNKNIYMDAYVSYHQRDELFKKESAPGPAMDITETLIGIGLGFSF